MVAFVFVYLSEDHRKQSDAQPISMFWMNLRNFKRGLIYSWQKVIGPLGDCCDIRSVHFVPRGQVNLSFTLHSELPPTHTLSWKHAPLRELFTIYSSRPLSAFSCVWMSVHLFCLTFPPCDQWVVLIRSSSDTAESLSKSPQVLMCTTEFPNCVCVFMCFHYPLCSTEDCYISFQALMDQPVMNWAKCDKQLVFSNLMDLKKTPCFAPLFLPRSKNPLLQLPTETEALFCRPFIWKGTKTRSKKINKKKRLTGSFCCWTYSHWACKGQTATGDFVTVFKCFVNM